MKTALIFGVSGQDGAHLSRFLLARDYAVHGTTRDAPPHHLFRLDLLGIRARVTTHTVSTSDADAMRRLIARVRPDEIYNFSGLSSVALSFADPELARSSIADAHLLLLETVRAVAPRARLFHCASSECFGDMPAGSAGDEQTAFAPRSPYAAAKVAAHRATVEYREVHGLHACSGILFNHVSALHGETFVTKKIVSAAAAIAAGTRTEPLLLGDLSASRDWGYADEYVEAMWLALQQPEPAEFVIATGESHTVEEFAAAAFAEFGLDSREHIAIDGSLLRRSEIRYSRGNPTRARALLGWEARTKFSALVRLLAEAARQRPVPASDDDSARNMSRKSSQIDQSHMYIRS